MDFQEHLASQAHPESVVTLETEANQALPVPLVSSESLVFLENLENKDWLALPDHVVNLEIVESPERRVELEIREFPEVLVVLERKEPREKPVLW